MSKLIDLTGQRFGKLTVLRRVDNDKYGKTMWECRCNCGNECSVRARDLRRGQTKSCGCMRSELHTTHGMSHTRVYKIWEAMKQRCNNPSATNYEYYGGRGIKVCDRWKSFENFYDDMIGTYFDGLTIDRINVDGNYEPSNCRWITMKDQARNRRPNIMITIDGETMCLAEWCRKFNLEYTAIRFRIYNLKWTPEEALKTPIGRRRKVEQCNIDA